MKKVLLLTLVVSLLFIGCATTNQVKEYEYEENSVVIKGSEYDIYGTMVKPITEEKVPIVIMMHGTGSQKDEAGNGFKMLAPSLAIKGIASIRFDFPGSGDSKASYRLYCNTTAIRDAIEVAEYASNLDDIDGNRIGVLGWSQGGTDALLAAGSSDIFKSVATWAGSLNIGEMATKEMREEAKKQGYTLLKFEWREPLELSQKWIDEADNMNILEYAFKTEAPIGSFHGAEDKVVPLEDSIEVQAISKNDNSKLIIIPETGHTFGVFSGSLDKYNELKDKTVEWFLSTL